MLLQAEDVHKNFKLGKQEIDVLRGVDLSVDRGEMLALLGESGSGKSTLLHVMGLLDPPSSGRILFDGRAVHDAPMKQRARLRHREIGFVFQFYHLIPELTALQNVKLGEMMIRSPMSYFRGRKDAHEKAVGLLEQVGLQHRLKHRPAELSGGERQRVAIARALISEPKIILADEPTGNLDSETADGILELLFDLNRQHNIAFLLVTHSQQLAERCDRVVRLRDGAIAD